MMAFGKKMTELVTFRQVGGPAAVVFLHGFCGAADKTWGEFPRLLMQEPKLHRWDLFGVGYPSALRIDIPRIWTADPGLDILARELRTAMALPPLTRYQAIAVVAHSMGGLVAQQALLDDDLAHRVSHLFLFGTPSNGLRKSRLGAVFKPQARDMSLGSPFLTALRSEWKKRYTQRLPFKLRVVAGDRDQFVPPASSLAPFPEALMDVVHGDHLSIVKPTDSNSQSVKLVVEGLLGAPRSRGIVDSAMLAVEQGHFKRAIDTLLPSAAKLDDAALVQLALALDGCQRGDEALDLLDEHLRDGTATTTDAMGTLAGRLKRRWLVQRSAADLQRAKDLYAQALTMSEAANDVEQAMYHAINIGFLEAMSAPASSAVPQKAKDAANKALVYAGGAKANGWREATVGEANIVNGDVDAAALAYARAIGHAPSPRNIDSMHSQAMILAMHVLGERGAGALDVAFRMAEAP